MNKSRRMRWAGHVARVGVKRNACRILVGKPEGKRPLTRPRRKCEDNIKVDVTEMEWVGMDLIHLTHDWDRWGAVVNMVTKFRIPEKGGKFLSS
jgi:hypothetical protein